jgi:hypothetical protein
MSLYHEAFGFPSGHERPIFTGMLTYSQHALQEADSDRYGRIALPTKFDARATNAKLIEVEFDDRKRRVVKQVWRQSLDAQRDLVLVITYDGYVKTVWVNLKSDAHRTLDGSKYVKLKR